MGEVAGGRAGGDILEEGADKLGLALSPDACIRLRQYIEELQRWSKKINLVGKKQRLDQLVENHFLDSLLLLPCLGEADSLVDIGTGAGFPGLVCKAARPDLHLHLVEPRLKRVSFLRHIVRALSLQDVHIHPCRAGEVEGGLRQIRHFTSRAVADVGNLLALIAEAAGDECTLLCMKGPRWREEFEEAETVLAQTGFECTQVNEYTLPFSGAQRAVLLFYRNLP